MDLLQNIKSERARQKRKQPYRRRVFNTISGIVRGYSLDENFLELIDNTEAYLASQKTDFTRIQAKKVLELPLFPLVSRQEYRLAMTIAAKTDNPYLQFAHTPEEILLSAPLYEANPSLRPKELVRYDFETLIRYERAITEVKKLTEQASSLEREKSADGSGQGEGEAQLRLDSLRQRIKELLAFIAEVENKKSKSG